MKQSKKILRLMTIVGCILLGIGILLSGAGFTAMGFSLNAFTHPKGGKAVQETVFYKDSPKEIEVNIYSGNVTIRKDENAEELQVDAASNVYDIYMEYGALVVKDKDSFIADGPGKMNWYQILNLSPGGDYDVTITLPAKELDTVTITTYMGSIQLSQLQGESVWATTDSGNVEVTEVSAADKMEITSSMGDVQLQACTGGDLIVDSDMSNTDINDCQFENGKLTGRSGSIQSKDSTWNTLDVENDMGNCVMDHVTVSQTVTCATGMGNVELTKLSSPDIHLEADSGNITGSILGDQKDYQIMQETDMGNSNLKDQLGGACVLEVETSMGNIDLKFTK